MKIGIIGSGQLGRMLALSSFHLGIDFVFLDPDKNSPASCLGEHILSPFDDIKALNKIKNECDFVTFEFENIPVNAIEVLGEKANPHYLILEFTKQRFLEKSLCEKLNIPTVPFYLVKNIQDLKDAIDLFGFPIILKTVTGGYDGKGQFLLNNLEDLNEIKFDQNKEYLCEKMIDFDYEISIIAVRNKFNEKVFYPIAKNKHIDGILFSSEPQINHFLQEKAQNIIEKFLDYFQYVGVLAVEFFVQNGVLLVNELAPRVHNSGHWSIEACVTSQFLNHIRAIANLPLGSTELLGNSIMYNCLGKMPNINDVLSIPHTNYHSYKKEFHPKRKVGHITIMSKNENIEEFKNRLENLI